MWNPDQTKQQSGAEALPDHGLPSGTLEWVWNSVGVRYGHFFAGKWDGFELSIVKEDWRLKLGDLTDRQLQFGLDNLPPGRPPADVGEFRQLCLRAPAPTPQRALPPKRGPVQIPADVLATFERLREPLEDKPRVRWARGFVAQWGERKGLSEIHKQSLETARKVMRLHEQELARQAAEQAKRQEQGHAAQPTPEH